MQTKLLINGKLVAGEGKVEEVLNPSTGKVLAKVPEASRSQVDAAVRAAEAAFDGWSRTPPKDRAALLLRLAERIEGDGAAFAKLESHFQLAQLHLRSRVYGNTTRFCNDTCYWFGPRHDRQYQS